MAIDKRHKRKDKSRRDLLAALERLKGGQGTHPKHVGIKIRLTKEAVAREARLSPATLYRFPDVVEAINAAVGVNPQPARVPPTEARRRALIDEITELERRNALLVAENFRLMRILAKHNLIDGTTPTDLGAIREKKRLTKQQGEPMNAQT